MPVTSFPGSLAPGGVKNRAPGNEVGVPARLPSYLSLLTPYFKLAASLFVFNNVMQLLKY